MWFKNKSNNQIVKFLSLATGIHLEDGEYIRYLTPHTNTEVWEQIDCPIKEMTMEELENHFHCRVKIKS